MSYPNTSTSLMSTSAEDSHPSPASTVSERSPVASSKRQQRPWWVPALAGFGLVAFGVVFILALQTCITAQRGRSLRRRTATHEETSTGLIDGQLGNVTESSSEEDLGDSTPVATNSPAKSAASKASAALVGYRDMRARRGIIRTRFGAEDWQIEHLKGYNVDEFCYEDLFLVHRMPLQTTECTCSACAGGGPGEECCCARHTGPPGMQVCEYLSTIDGDEYNLPKLITCSTCKNLKKGADAHACCDAAPREQHESSPAAQA